MRVFSAALLATAIGVAAMVVGWSTLFFSAGAQEVSADANVRISAQRLDDGRVQFGLRALDGSGEYADPVEPRVNSFNPASTRTGRWLSSSALILEVDESGRGRLVPSEQFEAAPPTETTLVSGIEEWAGDMRYSAFHDADGDLVTTVSVYSAATGAPDGELRTTITCQDGESSVTLGGLSSEIGRGARAQQINVSWSVDSGASASERRAAWPVRRWDRADHAHREPIGRGPAGWRFRARALNRDNTCIDDDDRPCGAVGSAGLQQSRPLRRRRLRSIRTQ